MGLGHKIWENRKRLKLTQAQLAEKLGLSGQAVSGWERGIDEPTVENLTALSRELGVSMDELTSPKPRHSTVIKSFDPDEVRDDDDDNDAATISATGERAGLSPRGIPEFDLRAGASYGGGYAVASRTRGRKNGETYAAEMVRGEWGFPENWLSGEMRLSYATTDILLVDGPSMSPDLEPGDRVLVDRSSRDPKQDAIFAVRDGDSIIIKHIQLVRGSEPPRIICRSSNPKYDPFELILDGLQADIIGRIAGRISKL